MTKDDLIDKFRKLYDMRNLTPNDVLKMACEMCFAEKDEGLINLGDYFTHNITNTTFICTEIKESMRDKREPKLTITLKPLEDE